MKPPPTITEKKENKVISLVDVDDNDEVYAALRKYPSAPKNIIISEGLSSVIYESKNAELNIIEFPDQGKAVHGSKVQLIFKNGNIYEGDVLNGMLHGTGCLTWIDGTIYEGEFQFNKVTGEGTYRWPDGSTYTGQVLDSLRSGFGTFTQNGVIYEGFWEKGLRHGKGELKHPSGTCYKGDFVNGHKQGFGRIDYPNGNFYEGDWHRNQKNGFGTMFWKTLDEKYVGQWANNLQNGFGTHLWLEERGEGKFLRNRYEGFWVNGFREGFGIFYYANGTKYEGEWQGNLKHGFARFTDDNGDIKFCTFVDDKNPEQQAVSVESILKDNANINNTMNFEGEFEESKKDKEDTIIGEKSMNMEINEVGSFHKTENLESPTKSPTVNGDSLMKSPRKTSKKKTTQPEPKNIKKHVIEINPFYKTMNISDLFKDMNENSTNIIMKNVTNMLLRHNPALRRYYKSYANLRMPNDSETFENEIHFALNLQKLWKIMRDIKILTPKVSLGSINRTLLQGVKAVFPLTIPEKHMQKKLELLKNNEEFRNYSDEELLLSNFVNTFIQNEFEQDSLLPETNFHEGSRILLYRQFTEALTRLAWLRAEDPKEMHRVLEKIITGKLQPIFELKNKKTKDSSSLGVSYNYGLIFEEFRSEIYEIFKTGLVKSQSGRFGTKDETILVKTMHDFLKKAGFIQNEEDKWIFIQIIEKYNDPEETISGLSNETMNSTNDKAAKKKEKEAVILKNKRMCFLVENELIYEEFQEFLRLFLMKKKEGNLKTEADIKNFFKRKIDEITKNCKRIVPKERRIWPESNKDAKLKNLKFEKEEKRKLAELKAQEEKQKKKEEFERNLMFLEDKNILGDKELEDVGNSEEGSQIVDNESEGEGYF